MMQTRSRARPRKEDEGISTHAQQRPSNGPTPSASSSSNLAVTTRLLALAVFIVVYLYTLWQWFASVKSRTDFVSAGNTAIEKEVDLSLSLDFVKKTQGALSAIVQQHHVSAIGIFSMVYLFKQTFAIPGSAVLNILAGAILPTYVAVPLTCVLTACGATSCYMLSYLLGSEQFLVKFTDRFLPGKLGQFRSRVSKAQKEGDLFFFLLFLRLFPFSPNWFLNLASPWLGVSVRSFSASVALGLLPYNFITCQAGTMISSIESPRDIMTPRVVASLASIAAVALLPIFLKKRMSRFVK